MHCKPKNPSHRWSAVADLHTNTCNKTDIQQKEYIPICDLCEYANVLSGSADLVGPVELAPILKHAAIHMNKTINNGLGPSLAAFRAASQ
jgi:hypothetical protein